VRERQGKSNAVWTPNDYPKYKKRCPKHPNTLSPGHSACWRTADGVVVVLALP